MRRNRRDIGRSQQRVRAGAVLALLSLMPAPAALRAQTAPPPKLTASLGRVFGTGAVADTFSVDGATIYRVHRGDVPLGYAQVRNVKGKDQPITFLVALDTALRLQDVDILVYREAYGGEVAQEAWRRQFRGKGPDAPLAVGGEIRSISGATISVNAVTAGVRRTVADFALWKREGRLP